MPPQLSMVGLIVEDMARSLEFYRRLGLEIPEGAEDRPHVEVKTEGDLTFFWDASFAKTYDPGREAPAGGYRVILEFFLDGREAVEAAYAQMTSYGYRGHRAPFATPFAYLAMVDDPDGNTVLLSGG